MRVSCSNLGITQSTGGTPQQAFVATMLGSKGMINNETLNAHTMIWAAALSTYLYYNAWCGIVVVEGAHSRSIYIHHHPTPSQAAVSCQHLALYHVLAVVCAPHPVLGGLALHHWRLRRAAQSVAITRFHTHLFMQRYVVYDCIVHGCGETKNIPYL